MTNGALIVGDVHISDKAPRSRTSTYTQDILDKLQYCVDAANTYQVPLIQAGDLFHIKAPARNSHRLVQKVHDVLIQVNKGVWIVPGNHDMSGDRLDSLDSQPLGALSRMTNMRLLMGQTPNPHGILGVPYLTEFDGGDWRDAIDRWRPTAPRSSLKPNLIVAHAPIFPPGQAPKVYASIDPYEWAQYWGEGTTYYGHIHDYHGTFQVDAHTFCNQGALSRGSLHESALARKPAATLWSGTDFTRIEIPHRPSEEVFLLAEAAKAAENRASALEFAQALGQTRLTSLTIAEVLATLKAQVSDKNVMKIIEQVLEDVQ